MSKRYTVIYRTGGTDNFVWQRTLESGAYDDAIVQRDAVRKMGYAAFVISERRLAVQGLPDSFDAPSCEPKSFYVQTVDGRYVSEVSRTRRTQAIISVELGRDIRDARDMDLATATEVAKYGLARYNRKWRVRPVVDCSEEFYAPTPARASA